MTGVGATDAGGAPRGALGPRIERIGWAVFLIMAGSLALVPNGSVPNGTWLSGTGTTMTGLNVVRHLDGLPASRLSAEVGTAALAEGLHAMPGVNGPVLPALLAAIGLQAMYAARRTRRGTP